MTALERQFGDTLIRGVPLSSFTTLKVGGPAEGFLTITNMEDLKQTLSILQKDHIPFLIIGRGTNLIIPDEGIRGLVIHLKGYFETIRTVKKTKDATYLWSGAGATLPSLLAYTAHAGLSGLEPLADIPATVGGAVKMNAGIPEFSVFDTLSSVTCLSSALTVTKLYARRLHPTYRDMQLPKDWIILDATFRLRQSTEEIVRKKIQKFQKKREKQLWRRYPTAGSIFKNPEGKFAGRLIEACGLKGYQIGDAQISPEHANVIINKGHATAKDILALIAFVREQVHKKMGIKLDLEVVVARN